MGKKEGCTHDKTTPGFLNISHTKTMSRFPNISCTKMTLTLLPVFHTHPLKFPHSCPSSSSQPSDSWSPPWAMMVSLPWLFLSPFPVLTFAACPSSWTITSKPGLVPFQKIPHCQGHAGGGGWGRSWGKRLGEEAGGGGGWCLSPALQGSFLTSSHNLQRPSWA